MERNTSIQKCGEILVDIKSKNKKNKIYIFQCTFCDIQCDQLKKFSLHIGEEHLNDFDEILKEAESLKETEILKETELKFEAEPEEFRIPSFNDVEDTPDIKVFEIPIKTKPNINPDPLDTVNAAGTSTNTDNLIDEIKYEIIEHDNEMGAMDGTVLISDSDKSDSDSDEDYVEEVPLKKRKTNKNAKKGRNTKRKENTNESDSENSKEAESNVSIQSGDDNKLIPYKFLVQQHCYTLDKELKQSFKWKSPPDSTPTKRYKKHNIEDKRKIIDIAAQGADWQTLAAKLGVNYKTAYRWVTEGIREPDPQQCKRPKILTDEEQEQLLQWLEEKPFISLQELKQKVQRDYQKSLTITTISNNLNGKIYTLKHLRYEPIAMNNFLNKQKRATYVKELNRFMENGKQIIWIDETNFNLYWRKSRSWNKRNPNVCLMGGMTSSNVLLIASKRGCFEVQDAQEWLSSLMSIWLELGNRLQDLVVVCDHTLHQNQLETVFDNSPVRLHRLAPFSSMLNPIEYICSKIKNYTKAMIGQPDACPSNNCEDHLLRLESTIEEAKTIITTIDCEVAVQQATQFYCSALELQDMPVGL